MVSILNATNSLEGMQLDCTLRGEWCPPTTTSIAWRSSRSIARLLHHTRGVVPPHYRDPATNLLYYVFALGACASRGWRGVATLGSDEPKAEGGCWTPLRAFVLSVLC